MLCEDLLCIPHGESRVQKALQVLDALAKSTALVAVLSYCSPQLSTSIASMSLNVLGLDRGSLNHSTSACLIGLKLCRWRRFSVGCFDWLDDIRVPRLA
jgi:hypothetical protein